VKPTSAGRRDIPGRSAPWYRRICVAGPGARGVGPGRDEAYAPPPGQIPACAASAPGSSLGSWRRSGEQAAGVAPSVIGATSRTNWQPVFWWKGVESPNTTRYWGGPSAWLRAKKKDEYSFSNWSGPCGTRGLGEIERVNARFRKRLFQILSA